VEHLHKSLQRRGSSLPVSGLREPCAPHESVPPAAEALATTPGSAVGAPGAGQQRRRPCSAPAGRLGAGVGKSASLSERAHAAARLHGIADPLAAAREAQRFAEVQLADVVEAAAAAENRRSGKDSQMKFVGLAATYAEDRRLDALDLAKERAKAFSNQRLASDIIKHVGRVAALRDAYPNARGAAIPGDPLALPSRRQERPGSAPAASSKRAARLREDIKSHQERVKQRAKKTELAVPVGHSPEANEKVKAAIAKHHRRVSTPGAVPHPPVALARHAREEHAVRVRSGASVQSMALADVARGDLSALRKHACDRQAVREGTGGVVVKTAGLPAAKGRPENMTGAAASDRFPLFGQAPAQEPLTGPTGQAAATAMVFACQDEPAGSEQSVLAPQVLEPGAAAPAKSYLKSDHAPASSKDMAAFTSKLRDLENMTTDQKLNLVNNNMAQAVGATTPEKQPITATAQQQTPTEASGAAACAKQSKSGPATQTSSKAISEFTSKLRHSEKMTTEQKLKLVDDMARAAGARLPGKGPVAAVQRQALPPPKSEPPTSSKEVAAFTSKLRNLESMSREQKLQLVDDLARAVGANELQKPGPPRASLAELSEDWSALAGAADGGAVSLLEAELAACEAEVALATAGVT